MKCLVCNKDKFYHHFKIEFIDRMVVYGDTYEKIIYSSICNSCKFEVEKKFNEYTIIKKIKKVKNPKIKKLLIDFDEYLDY